MSILDGTVPITPADPASPPSIMRKMPVSTNTDCTESIGSDTVDSVATSPDSSPSVKRSPRKSGSRQLPPLPTLHSRTRSMSSESHKRSGSVDSASSSPGKGGILKKRPSRHRRIKSTSSREREPAGHVSEYERLKKKLRKTINRSGDKSTEAGEVLIRLGNCLFREGRFDDAIVAYVRATETRDGPHIPRAYRDLGTAHWTKQNFSEAVFFLKKALKIFRKECKRTGLSVSLSPEIADIHHQLGLVHALQGTFEIALSEIELACRMRVEIFGSHHPITGRTMEACGRVYAMSGESERALQRHEEALTVLQGTPHMVNSLNSIAEIHMRRHDVVTAIHYYVEVVRIRKTLWRLESAKPAENRSFSVAKKMKQAVERLAAAYIEANQEEYAQQCLDMLNT